MALNLTTKADYKSYVGIKSTNDDAIIELLIPKVSQLVKTYCRRTFVDYWDTPKVEVFDGGLNSVLLKEPPVVQVQSVQVSKDYGQTYTDLVQYTDWVVQGDEVRSLSPGGFEKLINGYKVTYTAGFEDVPGDIEVAVMDIISYYLKNDAAVHTSKNSNPNSMQVQYITGSHFPAHIKRVLDLHVADYS
jgi:hypothetical protein